MTTVWQQLGAFVNKIEDLSDDQLVRFKSAGGAWIIPLVGGDPTIEEANRALTPHLQARCAPYGIKVGAWWNGWGESSEKLAAQVSGFAKLNGLSPIILDLEYDYTGPNAWKMPELLNVLRGKIGGAWSLGVSTNAMNNSAIYNGRTLNPTRSFYTLGVRALPQWYSWVYRQDGAYRPDMQMKWLKEHGDSDYNFKSPVGPFGRGLPLSYVHGTVEVSGVEGADLDDELHLVQMAQRYGFTKGVSLYLLERMPESDFGILAKYRGLWA